MFIHLKKNKKFYFTILLLLLFLFIIVNKVNNKFLEKFDNLKIDPVKYESKNYKKFFLKYKSINESLNFENIKIKNILPRVAHAGGGFKNKTYTNSIDALEENKEDFLFFEIDFYLTEDNKVVCSHDHSHNLKSFKNFNSYIKTNKEFKECTFITLRKWLYENPNKIIITDFKNKNIEGLKFISENFLDFSDRFIPQIYHPKEYHRVKKLGFKNIIWTLYKYNKSNDSVLLYTDKMDLFAVTMNRSRAVSGLAKELNKKNIKSYVHTINSIEDYYRFLEIYKVDQIYTDWIR